MADKKYIDYLIIPNTSTGIKEKRYIQDQEAKKLLDKKGQANGFAELDANGKVPSSQLPSFVDDVLEYSSTSSFPVAG
jgi:hypothetical protein